MGLEIKCKIILMHYILGTYNKALTLVLTLCPKEIRSAMANIFDARATIYAWTISRAR